jgi:hypothetical protein
MLSKLKEHDGLAQNSPVAVVDNQHVPQSSVSGREALTGDSAVQCNETWHEAKLEAAQPHPNQPLHGSVDRGGAEMIDVSGQDGYLNEGAIGHDADPDILFNLLSAQDDPASPQSVAEVASDYYGGKLSATRAREGASPTTIDDALSGGSSSEDMDASESTGSDVGLG